MSNPNNTSHYVLLILLSIFGIPVVGTIYAANLGAISIIGSILGIICFLLISIILLKRARENERELENTAEYIGAFSEGLRRAGFIGSFSVALFLAIWFAMPLFMETIDNDFQKRCQHTGGGATPLEKFACKLK